MTSMNHVRLAMFIAVMVSLVAYHLTNELTDSFASSISTDIFVVAKIVQVTLTGAFLLLLIYSRWFVRLIMRDKYIAGYYCGNSAGRAVGKGQRDKGGDQYQHVDVFTIVQNLFETRIEGSSHRCKAGRFTLVSTWNGQLFRRDGSTCFFGMDLSTARTEHSVLQVTFRHGHVHGFYYSGDAENSVEAKIWGTKVSRAQQIAVLKAPCGLPAEASRQAPAALRPGAKPR